MKINFLNMIPLALIILFVSINAQNDIFSSDVKTEEKPWTHLNFYNDPMNFQFAIVSDNTGSSREGVFEKAINKLNILKPEFVMSVGDLIEGYTQDTSQINLEWTEFNTSLMNLESPFFYLPGNHDITNVVMQKEWEKRYGRRYYHFNYKNVLFITLDSNDDDDFSITEEQTNFVLQSLKDNPDVRWTFLFMHHPIWTYDTNNRFETIEKVLKDRKYTVFAGHTHRYHHSIRNENNYYILGTTGGGSSLVGHRFGRFDHITWLTVTEDGPVFANLELDHIHPHDVSNDQTTEMAKSLLNNSSFEHVLLTNDGDKFTDGTLYLYMNNSTDFGIKVDINFYHNHDIKIDSSKFNFELNAETDTTLEISLKSFEANDYASVDMLQYDWTFQYLDEQYSDFSLEGKYILPIKPFAKATYITPNILQFSDSTSVKFNFPFKNLIPRFTIDGTDPSVGTKIYENPIKIKESTQLRFSLFNNRNQFVALPTKDYYKINMLSSVKAAEQTKGLKYFYFEGEWDNLPKFDVEKSIKSGIVNDFLVSDIANRDDNFGLVYTGFIDIPKDDFYIFRMKADDASRLYFHDKLLIDDSKGDDFGAIYLQKGYHPIRIDFMEQKGSERLRMYYKNEEEDEWNFMYFDMFYTN